MSELQQVVMQFVDSWVRSQKTAVPRQEIVMYMTEKGMKSFTITSTLDTLVRKGYLRRGRDMTQKTRAICYVQIRSF